MRNLAWARIIVSEGACHCGSHLSDQRLSMMYAVLFQNCWADNSSSGDMRYQFPIISELHSLPNRILLFMNRRLTLWCAWNLLCKFLSRLQRISDEQRRKSWCIPAQLTSFSKTHWFRVPTKQNFRPRNWKTPRDSTFLTYALAFDTSKILDYVFPSIANDLPTLFHSSHPSFESC